MKRSDILKELVKPVEIEEEDGLMEITLHLYPMEAEAILKRIEALGMLPSSIRFNATGDYVNINDTDILHDNDISFAFEPEEKV